MNVPLTKEQKSCAHKTSHSAEVSVNYLEDSGRFMADIRVSCAECGLPFQFLGLPLGLNLGGAAMSVDGREARIAISPVGRVLHPLEGLSGFGVKAS